VALLLLAAPALAAPCLRVRHLDVPAPSGETQRVCISPGQTTVFSFNAQLAPGSVTLEEADDFTWMEPGASTLKLVPSEKAPLGREFLVTVRFADGTTPSSAAFVLVVHAAEAASLVEVHRRKRTVESYQQELRAKEEEARTLREENARLRSERESSGGLMGFLLSEDLERDGVAVQDIATHVTRLPTNPLNVELVTRYRTTRRVAFEMVLENPEGAPTWRVERATLTREGKPGEELKVLRVWQEEPIPPGQKRRLILETELPRGDAQGLYTLRLWDAEGQRVVTLAHVPMS